MRIHCSLLLLCLFSLATEAQGDAPTPTPVNLASAPAGRELWSLDNDWSFVLGKAGDLGRKKYLQKAAEGFTDRDFANVKATPVRLPHDWAVDLPPVQTAVGLEAFKPLGYDFPDTSIGWYWRSLTVPASDLGRRIRVRFDGIYRDAKIWVNGHYLGDHEPGYTSIDEDITELLHYGGKNVIVVRVDASQREGWWYEGAGIYRNAWLEVTDPVAIAPNGVFVRTEFAGNQPQSTGNVLATVKVENDALAAETVSVHATVLDPLGHMVGETTSVARQIDPQQSGAIDLALPVDNPALWSTTTPALYTLVTSIRTSDGQARDEVSIRFGFRTIAFDAQKGFLLNGQPLLLKGVCMHADFPTVGTALTKSLHAYRISVLKSFGCNAIRMSHGPADPEFMDACDEAGILVMAETRAFGTSPYALDQLQSLIERDRNHPCVVLWSIGNEENEDQDSLIGQQTAQKVVSIVHGLDPTRPTTMANNGSLSFTGVNAAVDVHGWNYGKTEGWMQYHHDHPGQPTVVTETYSGRGTRGIYAIDPQWGRSGGKKGSIICSSYGPSPQWRLMVDNPWLSGWFVWTGFDYAGEAEDYDWPIVHSSFGVVDRCGFWKDLTYGYAASWTDKPVLHLLPHWNWAGKEGTPIRVIAVNNAPEVELFLNGKSLGRKPGFGKGPDAGNIPTEWQVPYAPGTLEAKAYDGDKVVSTDKVETTGAPAAISLTATRSSLPAQFGEYTLIKTAIVDAQGRTVPTADNTVSYTLTGPATISGVSAANPFSHDPEQGSEGKAFNGLLMAVVQAQPQPGSITITAHSAGLPDQQVTVQSVATPAAAPDWP
jgi:beta-galactosidase